MSTSAQNQGFIILETNYRIYAYTGSLDRCPGSARPDLRLDNPLQTAVLNLFVTLKSRYPNLVVGAITRDSVKKALANGITADQVRPKVMLLAATPLIRKFEPQIISYLTTHAHAQMRKNVRPFYSVP